MAAPLSDDALLRDVPEFEGFKVLDPAVLFARLGKGGMGAVYRGHHLNLDIDVAVKCLRRELADDDAQFRVRFEREARLAANLTHQNLVRVFDVRSSHGVSYLVMEFVHGENARERVARKGPLAEPEAVALILGAARGLGEAHAAGIVHRDIKPDNLMVSVEGRVKVADLGLAKVQEGQEQTQLTRGILGTPHYMPPEQWQDTASVGPAGDVWALGATLYFLLTGAEGIQGQSMAEISRRVLQEPFPDVRARRPEVSAAVAALIARATAADPAQRFADARAFATALEQTQPPIADAALADRAAGSRPNSNAVVTPPPAQTLARIKVALGTATTKLEDIADTVAQAPRSRSRAALGVGLALVTGAVLLWQWDRLFPPPDPGPAQPVRRLDWVRLVPDTVAVDGETGYPFEVTDKVLGIEFRLVRAGTFAMGSPADDGNGDEHPAHEVHITRPFYLSRCEVTVGQWRAFLAATGYRPAPGEQTASGDAGTWDDPFPGRAFAPTDTHPVTHVSWLDATSFCKNYGFRLPTEAEWEYACRGGEVARYPWGGAVADGDGKANVNNNSAMVELTGGLNFPFDDGHAFTAPVGSFAPNRFGLCDMIGNVEEWCADAYDRNAYATAPPSDPQVLAGDGRVLRGGSFAAHPEVGRCARRSHAPAAMASAHAGFRIARTP